MLSTALAPLLNPTPTYARAVTPELRTPSLPSSPNPFPLPSNPSPLSLHQHSWQNPPQKIPPIAPSQPSDSSPATTITPPQQQPTKIGTQTPPENQSQEARTAQQRQQFLVNLPLILQVPIEIGQRNPIIDELENNIEKAKGISIQEREPLRKIF